MEVFHKEEENSYHAHSKSGECMSSHMLMMFMDSPYKYHHTIIHPKDEDNSVFLFGRAAHKYILENDDFNNCYTVSDGPVNEKTGVPYGRNTKKWQEWESEQVGDIISTVEFDQIADMYASVHGHEVASTLLDSNLNPSAMAEATLRGKVFGVKCQIRVDFLNNRIIDLKTCRDISMFEYDARTYHYDIQAAFYRMVARELTGTEYPVNLIAVDKTPYHITGVWEFPTNILDAKEREIRSAMERYKFSLEADNWPTNYEEMRYYTGRR